MGNDQQNKFHPYQILNRDIDDMMNFYYNLPRVMMISRPGLNSLIFITLILNLIFGNGEYIQNAKCDETAVNMHMHKCYKEHIDSTIDATSPENAYFMDGNLLCQAYNKSSSYRKCLFSIFGRNQICSFQEYPYSYEYSKVYWKLILSSCIVENNDHCSPSNLSQHIINKCHYSFDERFPTKCKEFLRSLKCLERNEMELIPLKFGSTCSRNKAYYYFYGDLSVRLQLAINICET